MRVDRFIMMDYDKLQLNEFGNQEAESKINRDNLDQLLEFS
jgi:hypothetical protein